MLGKLTLFKNRLGKEGMAAHSLIMIAAILLAASFNYFYLLFMSWRLDEAHFGILFTLSSIAAIVSLLSQTFQTSTAKFTSKFKTQNKLSSIRYLWGLSLKRTLLLGSALFLISAVSAPALSRFLNIDNYWYVVILFTSIILTFSLPVNFGVLQGLQKFMSLGCSIALWSFLKLAVAVVCVYVGFGLYGVLGAYLVAYMLVFLVTLLSLRRLLPVASEKAEVESFLSYTGLTFLAILSFAILTNLDIVLVKHYLSAEDAGDYATIAVLGKIALYAPTGIAVAMFPKTSELFENQKAHWPILARAVLLSLPLALGILLVLGCFSNSLVSFLYGDKYPLVAPYLLKYGLSMTILALCLMLMNYFLSLNKTRVAYPLIVAAVLQLALIAFFHGSIAQIVDIVLISALSCLALMALFGLRAIRRTESAEQRS